jgi:hypothetical protein
MRLQSQAAQPFPCAQLGLYHDGTYDPVTGVSVGYFKGQGDWAPIMGAPLLLAVAGRMQAALQDRSPPASRPTGALLPLRPACRGRLL